MKLFEKDWRDCVKECDPNHCPAEACLDKECDTCTHPCPCFDELQVTKQQIVKQQNNG